MDTVGARLRMIRKELKFTQEALAQRLGIGKSALSMIETGRAALSERNKNILIQDLNVSQEWIEKGTGNIFEAPVDLGTLRRRNGTGTVSVPLYNMEGTDGLSALFSGESAPRPVDYIYIPNLPKCDGAIYVVGDSMYPLLKSGDIVLYKQITNIEDIFWGDMYLLSVDIDGEEYITVKYIHRSDKEGYVKLVSQNPLNSEKDVEVSKIRALAFIKASIRMNSIR